MIDENGKEYIDFFAGAGALNYGHNPDYMVEKMIAYLQSDGILHSMDMFTAPKREFLEYFTQNILAPRGLNYKIQFAGPTGTNAVEAAIKLARKVKGRENVFACGNVLHVTGLVDDVSTESLRAGKNAALFALERGDH